MNDDLIPFPILTLALIPFTCTKDLGQRSLDLASLCKYLALPRESALPSSLAETEWSTQIGLQTSHLIKFHPVHA